MAAKDQIQKFWRHVIKEQFPVAARHALPERQDVVPIRIALPESILNPSKENSLGCLRQDPFLVVIA